MAGFDENINIDVYRFREIAQSLFNGLNLSDGAILNRIEENRQELFEYSCFKSDLENLLGLEIDPANLFYRSMIFEQLIDRVRELIEEKNNTNNPPKQVLYAPALEDPKYRVEGLEEINTKLQQAFLFMDEVVKLVDSPDPIRAKIEIKRLIEFRDQVKALLFHEPTMATDEDAITKLKGVCKTNNRIHDFWVKVALLTDVDLSLEDLSLIDKNMIAEIERLKANQGDGKKAFIQGLREALERERADSRNLCDQITDLRHDLLVANKVIARLVSG